MSALTERDAMLQELIRLKIANQLMDEEMKRLQPELSKYETMIHPAARSVQAEPVSTSSITEKTKGIKQETSKLKTIENDLTSLNNRVKTLFVDVERRVSHRDALFSEIEDVTSKINSLTIGSSRFEDDSDQVRNNVLNESTQLASMTNSFQQIMKDKLLKLAALKKKQKELENIINIDENKINVLKSRKVEYASKIDLDSLTQLKTNLSVLNEKTVEMNNYLISVTRDEGHRLENLTSSITECEVLKKKKAELTQQLEELNEKEKETGIKLEDKKKEVEMYQIKLKELTSKKELLSNNHETAMAELKDRINPQIECLKERKEKEDGELEAVKKRMEHRDECLRLRKEFDAEGKVDALELSGEIESIKQEIEATRASITKTMSETEYYRTSSLKCDQEADELHTADKPRKEEQIRLLHEKDGVANHYELEVFNLKKKLDQERIEKEKRLAMEERRLLEKAKDDKDRRDKEERRRKDKEIEKEKLKKAKEEEEKKKKREKEIQDKKKKEEAKNRMMETIQSKNILSRVQQGRKNMETAASIPFAHNANVLMRPPVVPPPLPPAMGLRHRSIPKKPMFIYDDDSSEDDDDDMSDFLMDDSIRIMPKVPEKYAGSPPRVDKQRTPLNPFELSFTDAQSSTPIRMQNNPSPAFEVSFNQVVTSTPQIRRSKGNKKQTRPRGKKKN